MAVDQARPAARASSNAGGAGREGIFGMSAAFMAAVLVNAGIWWFGQKYIVHAMETH